MDLRFKTTDSITFDGEHKSSVSCVYITRISVDAENNLVTVIYSVFKNKTACDNYKKLNPVQRIDYKGFNEFKKEYAVTDTKLNAAGLMTFIKNKIKGEFTKVESYA